MDNIVFTESYATNQEFPNILISNYGRVIDIHTKEEIKQKSYMKFKSIEIYNNENNKEIVYIHNLVYDTFHKDHKYTTIEHVDGNHLNNHYLNLKPYILKNNR